MRTSGILALLLFFTSGIYAAPVIQHWQSDGGADVYYIEAPELPMVDVKLVFDAGSARDDKYPGLAEFVNGMLEEGVDGLDADQIAAGFDDVGTQFSLSASRDMATLSIRSLTQQPILDKSLELLAKVISSPTFPEKAVERVRKQILAGLAYEKQSAAKITAKAYYKALYQEHPYGQPSSGDEKSINSITRKMLVDFYQRYYSVSNAMVVIVGALDKKQAKAVANRLLQNLPKGRKAPALAKVKALSEPEQITIKHPSTQTHIMMGHPGYKRGDKDKWALYVGNHILGGSGLVSRISDEIREKRGLSYSAYSYFSPSKELGVFTLGLQTKNSSADEALSVLKQTLKKFVENGPTEKELEAAKKNITGKFPLEIDSNSDLIAYMTVIGFYNLDLDYFNKFIPSVNAVTVEQIKDAYSRRVNPEQMVTVLVGGM